MSLSSVIIADGPALYYILGESLGATTAVDSSGNGHNSSSLSGTTFGGSDLAAVNDTNTSVALSGSSSFINIPTNGLPSGSAAWSLEALVKPTNSTNANNGHIITMGEPGVNNSAAFIAQNSGGGWNIGSWGGTDHDYTGFGTSTASKIYHIIGTYDSKYFRLYVNGVLVIFAYPNTLNLIQATPSIGSAFFSSTSHFNFVGSVQHAALYAKKLTDAQVANHFATAFGYGPVNTNGIANGATIKGMASNRTFLMYSLSFTQPVFVETGDNFATNSNVSVIPVASPIGGAYTLSGQNLDYNTGALHPHTNSANTTSTVTLAGLAPISGDALFNFTTHTSSPTPDIFFYITSTIYGQIQAANGKVTLTAGGSTFTLLTASFPFVSIVSLRIKWDSTDGVHTVVSAGATNGSSGDTVPTMPTLTQYASLTIINQSDVNLQFQLGSNTSNQFNTYGGINPTGGNYAVMGQINVPGLNDTATASEVDALAKKVTDAGSVSESYLHALLARYVDSGSIAELVKWWLLLTETGHATETFTVTGRPFSQDLASAAEALAITNTLTVAESRAATEAIKIHNNLVVTESRSATEQVRITNTFGVSDSATATENFKASQYLLKSDIGTAAEVVLRTIYSVVHENGTASEGLLKQVIANSLDSGIASENFTKFINVLKTQNETGVASEALAITARLFLQDSGVASEFFHVLTGPNFFDTGSVSESVHVPFAQNRYSDTPSASEDFTKTITRNIARLLESGVASESFAKIITDLITTVHESSVAAETATHTAAGPAYDYSIAVENWTVNTTNIIADSGQATEQWIVNSINYQPLAQEHFIRAPFGVGIVTRRMTPFPPIFGSSAIAANYVVASGGAAAISANYTVQGIGLAAISANYIIYPSTLAFAVNGDTSFPRPERIIYNYPQHADYDTRGRLVLQGWWSMTWQWDIMTDSEIAAIMTLYRPSNPQVTVTYIDEDGNWAIKTMQMLPPDLGTRSVVIHQNVQLFFSRIQPGY